MIASRDVARQRRLTMYVIDARHYTKGRHRRRAGPARKMANFLTSAIAHASDFDRPEEIFGPACFKCRKRDDRRVQTGIADDGVVLWDCPACGTQGRILNWQGTFWDLNQGTPSD